MKRISKPDEGEYAPYAIMYIKLLPDDGFVLKHLADNLPDTLELVRSLPPNKLDVPCAEGEWTVKEILAHMIDVERIYSYRALRFARNDATALPGFEQDDYVPNSGANNRPINDLLDEFSAVRNATIPLFASLDESAFARAGVASGDLMSVRAAAYIIAGHELHHRNSIRENYLSSE
jgi:uncharacterized damage-inducible protein DinB